MEELRRLLEPGDTGEEGMTGRQDAAGKEGKP